MSVMNRRSPRLEERLNLEARCLDQLLAYDLFFVKCSTSMFCVFDIARVLAAGPPASLFSDRESISLAGNYLLLLTKLPT